MQVSNIRGQYLNVSFLYLNSLPAIKHLGLSITLRLIHPQCRSSDSLLLYAMSVIINGSLVLNPEVSLVSPCQGWLCPEGVICSHSSAPLPICLERKNNGFSITPLLLHPGRLALCLCLTIAASLAHRICCVSSSHH